MKELRIDWLRCDGHGVCAEVAPELFTLDDWGYPVVGGTRMGRQQAKLAARAAAACPAIALRLSDR